MSNPIIPHDEPADKAAPVVAGNRMTRPDAVAELMRLQKRCAFENRGREVEALAMAIHNIIRRHKQSARHTAKHYHTKGE